MKAASIFFGLLLAHCRPMDGCEPKVTRCIANVIDVCNADRDYQPLADCDAVSQRTGERFVCAFLDEVTPDGPVRGYACVPAADAGSLTAGDGGAP